jgi:hypothetical protein
MVKKSIDASGTGCSDAQLEAIRSSLHGSLLHAHYTVERAELVLLSLAFHRTEGITSGTECSFFHHTGDADGASAAGTDQNH